MEVGLVVDPPDHHQGRAVAEVGPERRHVDATGKEVLLLDHVLDGVPGERFERATDFAPALLGLAPDDDGIEEIAARQHLAPPPDLPATHLNSVTVPAGLEQRVVRKVDEGYSRVSEQGGAHVRVIQRRRWPAVQDRRRPGGDEVLGGNTVQVGMVDQCHLPRLQTLDEVLGAPTSPQGAAHGRA